MSDPVDSNDAWAGVIVTTLFVISVLCLAFGLVGVLASSLEESRERAGAECAEAGGQWVPGHGALGATYRCEVCR